MSPRQIFISFFDGFTAPLRILEKVQRPGSHSAELAALTKPEMLAAYGRVRSSIPEFLLKMKENELKRDAIYSVSVRIYGYMGLAAMIGVAVIIILEH
jgi:hypothetical protein